MYSKKQLACVLSTTLLAISSISSSYAAKNVIIMIGDGMGYHQVDAGSYWLTGQKGNFCFEQYHKCGVKTHSLDAEITDSAAAASAIATGQKVNNGTVSESPTGQPHKTILEIARDMGKKTGLVTTVTITHATPAGFGAHEKSRSNAAAIADDYVGDSGSNPDVIFGGGNSDGAFPAASKEKAAAKGYKFVYTADELAAMSPANTSKAIGLFNKGYLTYNYDRGTGCTEPYLKDMATKAISLLENDPDGFFLMVEGGKIDEACHGGNISCETMEAVQFNKAVKSVIKWMQGRDDTLLIVTADHETGGLAVTSNGIGFMTTAVWNSPGDHTAANVPFYCYGADADMVNNYIKDGAIENTDIFQIMLAAYTKPTSNMTRTCTTCPSCRVF